MSVLTIDQVAEHLKIGRGMVDRLVKDGEIPYFRAGCRIRFNLDDIYAWARAQYTEKSRSALEGVIPCPTEEPERKSGGSQSAEYASLLGLPYSRTRKRSKPG